MSKASLKWLRLALRDLDEISSYIAKDNPTAAQKVVQRVYEVALNLRDHPAMGRLDRVPGTRELAISGLPFILVYRVKGRRVEILRVLHGARKWPPEGE
ncbi:type II toxin-antitoxin system RelE/ParE family toxin [Thermosulfuriphilus ammonigenes]|uniref:Type II toxin-antitoxin system RelE/ParE family toxin n=1 Tax=Thermosulfuriphilus ammonigenes TaxID=1936021 RepID=A0A6G7PTX9_9BACT|nr:type II toxin-antitoxin system RelE/ParE family toxin [Thermosulfuriphilus ammonigenes]MBA2848865.1 addiction module RelE/StbE family toxin [Thermosulfuriphilus ammonigenes]QIJ71016.1 type II toxin-antitoxin system RelE/ParE family toxin [Thermosulfuriphilus ammonigenes]